MRSLSIIMFTILLLFACVAAGLIAFLPAETSASLGRILATAETTSRAVIVLGGAGLVGGLVIILVYLAWSGWQYGLIHWSRARIARAEATRAERDAHLSVTVAPPGHQVIAHELDGLPLVHRPLHLAPGRINGAPATFGAEELRRWQLYQLAHSTAPHSASRPDITIETPAQIGPGLPEYVNLADYLVGSPSLRSLFLGVGRLPDGQVKPVNAPLGRLVHIATGGSSGFGKSTFMLALAYQVLNARELPRPVLLDAQGVTFTPFDGDDRLLYPLASDPKDILAILIALVEEMTRRQQLFAGWRGVANLEQYNAVVSEADRLPLVPIFFDEFGLVADDKDIAGQVKKLVKACRKTGLSLIAGAQTWGADEISTSLRANLATTVHFYARDRHQSRVLLGDGSAADITRPGEARAILPGQPGKIELQAPDPAHLVEVEPELLTAGERPGIPELPETEADAGEFTRRVLELHEAGDSLSAISQQIFGYRNQTRLDEIKAALAEAGRIG